MKAISSSRIFTLIAGLAGSMIPTARGGPYSAGVADAANAFDAPVPGFVGPNGIGKARLDDGFGGFENPDNRVNPLFFAWTEDCRDYQRSDTDASFDDVAYAFGPVTGDSFDVVSLGDLTAAQITSGALAGAITLRFAKPIRNYTGADFAIFENGFAATFNTGGSGSGGIFAELAYVEVSQDGVAFHRFNPVSLTPSAVGGYGTINPTNVLNLAGKHVNAYGDSWGTPFDIGQLGLDSISYIRLVDIPGSGAFKDGAGNPIYDSWRTFGSGGFDLEAVGVISIRMTFPEWPLLQSLPANKTGAADDPDGDSIPNLLEYAFCLAPDEWDTPTSGWRLERIDSGGVSLVEIVTRRDERLTDITREVQVSTDMTLWTTIARSVGGAPYQPVGGFTPDIHESSVSGIASVGVIREDRIRDTRPMAGASRRFYRLQVSRN